MVNIIIAYFVVKLKGKEKNMKKILVALVLMLGVIFVGTMKLGAKMNTEFNEVRASHILVKTEAEANQIKKDIDAGTISFEEAAKKYSQCPSKAQGGDLGYFGRGMMVKPFEEASFDGEVGKVSNPVQTQFGWHLIKVVDKK